MSLHLATPRGLRTGCLPYGWRWSRSFFFFFFYSFSLLFPLPLTPRAVGTVSRSQDKIALYEWALYAIDSHSLDGIYCMHPLRLSGANSNGGAEVVLELWRFWKIASLAANVQSNFETRLVNLLQRRLSSVMSVL